MKWFYLIFDLITSLALIVYLVFLIFDMLDFIIKKIPPLPTFSTVIPPLLEAMENKEKKVFVDLGCGTGKVLLAVKKRYPETRVVGYEIWPSQFLRAKIKFLVRGLKADIFRKDLFKADLKEADIVFCFLLTTFMEKLEEKLQRELKSGAWVVSNTFQFPTWKPIKIIPTGKTQFGTLYIYQKE